MSYVCSLLFVKINLISTRRIVKKKNYHTFLVDASEKVRKAKLEVEKITESKCLHFSLSKLHDFHLLETDSVLSKNLT